MPIKNGPPAHRDLRLPELLEQDVLEPLVGDELLPGVENGHDVVGVLVLRAVVRLRLQEGLHLLQVLALLQQRYRIVLAPGEDKLSLWTESQVGFPKVQAALSVVGIWAYGPDSAESTEGGKLLSDFWNVSTNSPGKPPSLSLSALCCSSSSGSVEERQCHSLLRVPPLWDLGLIPPSVRQLPNFQLSFEISRRN